MKRLTSLCNGCTACYNVCPKQAITMAENSEGFLYPQIDDKLCIQCNQCEVVCPLMNNDLKLFCESSKEAYAFKSSNSNIQLSSTSGGMFQTLALEIINQGGNVYGAAYDENWRVRHIRVTEVNEIKRMADSKYSQSILGNIFRTVKTDLEYGTLVLFSGTPCQLAGLKSYLRKEYENLILVDVVCHGVPSPHIWNWYIDKLQEKFFAPAIMVKQKGKECNGWSWEKQYVRVDFKNQNKFVENIWSNSYMVGFLKDIYLRDSCYHCKFKTTDIRRVSDVTIADYWGCEDIEPDFFDDRGVSFVIVNTEKGKKVFRELQKNNYTKKTDLTRAITYNIALVQPYLLTKGKKYFWKRFKQDISLDKFDSLVKNSVRISEQDKKSISFRIKKKVERILQYKYK